MFILKFTDFGHFSVVIKVTFLKKLTLRAGEAFRCRDLTLVHFSQMTQKNSIHILYILYTHMRKKKTWKNNNYISE